MDMSEPPMVFAGATEDEDEDEDDTPVTIRLPSGRTPRVIIDPDEDESD